MKVFFAPDTSDHPNWGCRAMGAWFPRALARAGATLAGSAGSRWFMRRYEEAPDLQTLDDVQGAAEWVGSGRGMTRLAHLIRSCDMVYLNGENFVRPGTLKGRRLLFVAYLARVTFGKPCVLVNHSVDLSEPALAGIVRALYPLLDEIQFREQRSVDLAAAFAAPGRWRLIPDVAWAMPATPLQHWPPAAFAPGHFCKPGRAASFNPGRPYVTVCASSIFGLDRFRDVDATPAFVELCRRLNDDVAPVVLAAPDEPDRVIMKRVQKALGYPLLDLPTPFRRAMNVCGNAAVHVGGRWHPGIFAATGGTPLVAFGANTHKMHGLMETLGLAGPVFDAANLSGDIDAIVALAQSHVAAGQALRDRIRQRARELGSQVDAGMDCIRRMASS